MSRSDGSYWLTSAGFFSASRPAFGVPGSVCGERFLGVFRERVVAVRVATMAAAATRAEVLKVYKNMLRESGRFSFYNYRLYALRRVKDAFREHKGLQDPAEIQRNLKDAHKFLEIIKRQVTVGDLYKFEKLVIEVENDKNHD